MTTLCQSAQLDSLSPNLRTFLEDNGLNGKKSSEQSSEAGDTPSSALPSASGPEPTVRLVPRIRPFSGEKSTTSADERWAAGSGTTPLKTPNGSAGSATENTTPDDFEIYFGKIPDSIADAAQTIADATREPAALGRYRGAWLVTTSRDVIEAHCGAFRWFAPTGGSR